LTTHETIAAHEGRRRDMYSVLLQEEPVHAAAAESESFPVPVTVLIDGRAVSFEKAQEANYQVEPQSVLLVGSGGSPREYLVTFTLSDASRQAGYTFANPALKFFQGNSRNAGFRVDRDPVTKVSAVVSLFNTKRKGEPKTSDEFSLLFYDPEGNLFVHDPTIVWDPPNG
jgi:hypothetical protein